MNVGACVDVVKQIPPDVVRIVIDDEIVTAIYTPVREDRPVPISYFKRVACRKPKSMMLPIDPENVVALFTPTMIKVPVIEGTIEMKARIVGTVMSEPLIMIDMLGVVNPPVSKPLSAKSRSRWIAGRGWWDMTLIGTWCHLARYATTLRSSYRHQQKDCTE
jgi:hypothetical protein